VVVVAGATMATVDTKDFDSIGLGVWWAVVTVTTVGYGDVVPTTTGGRIVAALLMLVGIGFLSTLTATIASSFVAHDAGVEEDARADEHAEVMAALQRIEERLAALEQAS
jgi:voltage-gated potassium channel